MMAAATDNIDVTMGDLQDYVFIKLEENDADDFLAGTKKRLTLVEMVCFLTSYWSALEQFVEDVDIFIAKIHRMLYYYGDKVCKDLQGEIDRQDAQDTDSMALQTMTREAIEFKADKLDRLWKGLKMLKAGCEAQKKKIGEEGKARKFKKLLANLMTAAVRYCNEFKHEIQGYSRELTPYNEHKGMTMSLEESFNSMADKFCDAVHTALPMQWWHVAYMPLELDLYNKETVEDIIRTVYCHVL